MTKERYDVRLLYEEKAARRRHNVEIGLVMYVARAEAKVTLTALARELGITVPYLVDMEMGNRTYQEKYIEPAQDYCAKAYKRRKKLIKNQNIKQ